MTQDIETKDLDELLAEAAELLERINSEIDENIEDEKRAEFEKRTQALEQLTSEVHGKEGTADDLSRGEGMHEAFEEIARAMKSLKEYFS